MPIFLSGRFVYIICLAAWPKIVLTATGSCCVATDCLDYLFFLDFPYIYNEADTLQKHIVKKKPVDLRPVCGKVGSVRHEFKSQS